MKPSIVAGSLLTALSLAGPLAAQQVVIGNEYSTYRRPVVHRRAPERVIVVERLAPRVLVVERLRHRKHGHGRSWRADGFRPVVVYYARAGTTTATTMTIATTIGTGTTDLFPRLPGA